VREECRLRVFENRMLRRIFGLKEDEVTGKWRSYMLCTLPDIILVIKSRRLRWEEHVARMGTSTGAYWVLVVKPEGRRQPERPRNRREDNIKMDLTEVKWGHKLDRCGSKYGQVAGSCEYGNEPSVSIKCGKFLE
jgi:PAS domain-containing protein